MTLAFVVFEPPLWFVLLLLGAYASPLLLAGSVLGAAWDSPPTRWTDRLRRSVKFGVVCWITGGLAAMTFSWGREPEVYLGLIVLFAVGLIGWAAYRAARRRKAFPTEPEE